MSETTKPTLNIFDFAEIMEGVSRNQPYLNDEGNIVLPEGMTAEEFYQHPRVIGDKLYISPQLHADLLRVERDAH